MLNQHPLISWSSEFEFCVDHMPAEEGWPDLADYYNYLNTNRKFRAFDLQIDKSLSYPELVDSFLSQIHQKRGGKPIVGATVHSDFDRILRIWPDARFIYMLRDGRDVGRSTIQMEWASNMWVALDRWVAAERTWERVRPKLSPDRYTEIQYESLVRAPLDELTRICKFLGVEYSPAMLEYDTARRTTYEKPDPKLIAQWKTKLEPRAIQIAEARILPMLEARGYEPSGLPVLKASPAMERRLRLQNYWATAYGRLKLIGPKLFVENFVSKRVGVKSWRDKVSLRMNEITNSRLRH